MIVVVYHCRQHYGFRYISWDRSGNSSMYVKFNLPKTLLVPFGWKCSGAFNIPDKTILLADEYLDDVYQG